MAPVSNLPLALPGRAVKSTADPAALRSARNLARGSGTAANWRALAEVAVRTRHFAEAATAYAHEAALYTRMGDRNAAQIEQLKSDRFATTLALYRYGPNLEPARPLARLEPQTGCYLGAFIDRDDSLPSHGFASQSHGDIGRFNEITGKDHASFFMYRAYGQPFPSDWVAYVKSHHAIAHIAWEPGSLAEVRDDGYLRQFVADAAASDCPLFIRFAGEMNGDWTPYHTDPARYRQAFRMVYAAFRQVPKAALIWCPNSIPQNNLDAYYPGDDACDWVGVNLYSVPYLDNDLRRPGADLDPVDLLDYVYKKYSARKPIAIAEYAASHQSSLDHKLIPEFAELKLAQLYGSLPTRYPRVKLVDWYDCNNLLHARPGRQLNNYLLTEMAGVLDKYRHLVASSCFLGARDRSSPVVAMPLIDHADLPYATRIEAYVRTYVPRPRVYFRLDGKVILATDRPAGYSVAVSPESGQHTLDVLVYDDRNTLVTRRSLHVHVHAL